MKRLLTTLAALTLLAACSSPQVEEDKSPTEQAAESSKASDTDWHGHKRLTGDVVPRHYRLDLAIDPASDTFSGDVTIEAEVAKPTDTVHLHAESLEFSTVDAKHDGESVDVEHESVDNGGLVLSFQDELSKGPLELRFVYEAPLDKIPEGLYRVKSDKRWYAFTQFEPLEAREAFPSFDEPRFKTPFETSLTVPKGMIAASNGPKTGKTEGEEGVTWTFAETKPLPTYLVAFAVGEFDVVEAPDDAMGGVPLRVLTAKGNGELAQYALKQTPKLVAAQEKYFDQSFPFQKMDLVAVPNFAAGAMENVGLVTYRESLLLLDADNASASDRYAALSVMAHEYAHMWFGNSVTLGWWDDLWLNEAFATWMGGRTVQMVAPELEPELESLQSRGRVMSADSLKKSRAIRQPIETGGDVYNAFDGITYSKGAAILRMFEVWMGPETFRDGVRAYLDANKYGVGTTRALFDALAETSGKPVAEVMSGFLDQPGAPLVTVELDESSCEEGTPTLRLEQTRYLPSGSEAEEGEPWQIPMCVWYAVEEGEKTKKCFLFDGSEEEPRRDTVELEAGKCPTVVHPNAGEKGYYHWMVRPDSMRQTLVTERDRMSLSERVALLGHFKAAVRADEMPVDTYLTTLEGMAGEEHRLIAEEVIDTLFNLNHTVYRGEPSEAFRAWAGRLIEPYLQRIGFDAKDGEPVADKLLRPDVIKAAANLAADESIRQKARKATQRYLESPKSVPYATAKYALDIAARYGDAELWKQFRTALGEARSPDIRVQILDAMGHFKEPKLATKSLDLFLTDAVRAQNLWRVIGPVSGDPALEELAWSWMTDNYDAIVDKVGKSSAGSLPWIGAGHCSEAGQKKVDAFFSKDEHKTVSTDRNLAQAVESIGQCATYRDLIADGVRSYVGSK